MRLMPASLKKERRYRLPRINDILAIRDGCRASARGIDAPDMRFARKISRLKLMFLIPRRD